MRHRSSLITLTSLNLSGDAIATDYSLCVVVRHRASCV